jgi:hypothetical protein
MAVQYYLYCTWPLFFSFWIRTPRFWPLSGLLVYLVFVVLHLVYSYAFDAGTSVLALDILKPVVVLPLSCLLGCLLGQSLDAPASAFLRYRWTYLLECLFAGLLWIGAGLSWQLAPQQWWNYFGIVSASHILILVLSYWLIPHDCAWKVPGSGNSRLMHFHFFIVSSLIVDLCFSIGQTISGSTFDPVYYAIISLLVGLTYALVLNFKLAPEPRAQFFSPFPELPPDGHPLVAEEEGDEE